MIPHILQVFAKKLSDLFLDVIQGFPLNADSHLKALGEPESILFPRLAVELPYPPHFRPPPSKLSVTLCYPSLPPK